MTSKIKSALVLLGIGIISGIPSYYFHMKRMDVKNWIQTKATVVKSEIIRFTDRDTYYIRLTYDYEVEGERYEGIDGAFDESGEPIMDMVLGDLYDARDELGPGTRVKVFYNPEDPSDSATGLDINYGFIWGIAFGILFSLLGLAGLLTKRNWEK